MILCSIIIEKAVQSMMPKINIANDINWHNSHECDLLKELSLCLLSSSIKYEVALLYADRLQKRKYFQSATKNELSEKQIYECLTEPVSIDGHSIRYRFPKTKSEQLYKTISNIYGKGNTLKDILLYAETSVYARDLLVTTCIGIGYKQASMFIRNIGFAYDLAIIDTHIIDYLKLVDILPSGMIVRNKYEYSQIEDLYSNYAKLKQLDIKKLDIAIWNVMKVYKTEFA